MSDEKRTWYQRTHQFTPYTKADGTAVSDEFDAIQASFERIPAMRDDGKGFATSPLIPEPSDPNHPVPFKMLTETEASVNNARDDVTKKAQQVAHNAQSVATNTQTTINQAKSASQSAESASASSRSASNSEEMARKWASNPENEVVLDEKYSAYHYAQKVAQSAANLASAESSAIQSATIATQKAEEATRAAQKAESLAAGEIDYAKVLNVPHSNINTEGVVRLTNDTGLDDENLALTAKAGKELAEQISQLQQNVTKNYIPNDKKSSAVDSNSADTVATSAAVKTAYDKGVEAKNAADAAQHTANDGVSKANAAQNSANQAKSAADAAQHTANDGVSKANAAQTSANAANNNANGRILKTDISHVINGSDKAKVASEFALGELNKKFTLSQNLSETGWCKLPNGLILQWGKFNKGYGSVRDEQRLVTFPITFPNKVLFVGLTEFTNSWSYSTTVENRQRMTNSGFYVISQRNDSMYFALGF